MELILGWALDLGLDGYLAGHLPALLNPQHKGKLSGTAPASSFKAATGKGQSQFSHSYALVLVLPLVIGGKE